MTQQLPPKFRTIKASKDDPIAVVVIEFIESVLEDLTGQEVNEEVTTEVLSDALAILFFSNAKNPGSLKQRGNFIREVNQRIAISVQDMIDHVETMSASEIKQ